MAKYGERLTKRQMRDISERHHVPANSGTNASSVFSHLDKLGNNTWRAVYLNGTQVIFYHHTAIVTIKPDGSADVDMGGYQTRTTRERLNAYMPHGWQCYQQRGNLYLTRVTYLDRADARPTRLSAVPAAYSWTINSDGSLNTYELEPWPRRLREGESLLECVMVAKVPVYVARAWL